MHNLSNFETSDFPHVTRKSQRHMSEVELPFEADQHPRYHDCLPTKRRRCLPNDYDLWGHGSMDIDKRQGAMRCGEKARTNILNIFNLVFSRHALR